MKLTFERIPDTEGCINKVRCCSCGERVVALRADLTIHVAQHKRGLVYYRRHPTGRQGPVETWADWRANLLDHPNSYVEPKISGHDA